MDSKHLDNNLFIIYIVWIIILLLGIRFISKCKLWKPNYYLIMLVIFVIYTIILYQIQILWTCFPNIDTFQNQNTTFTLYNRDTIPGELLFQKGSIQTGYGNWDGPLGWPGRDKNGNPLSPNFYADDNNTDGKGNGNVCNNNTVLQLTELVSVSAQQLHDAQNAYTSLVGVQNTLNEGNLRDLKSIGKINDMINNINTKITA